MCAMMQKLRVSSMAMEAALCRAPIAKAIVRPALSLSFQAKSRNVTDIRLNHYAEVDFDNRTEGEIPLQIPGKPRHARAPARQYDRDRRPVGLEPACPVGADWRNL